MMTSTPLVDKDLLRWISQEYYDLNGSHYETLESLPSALEFSRLVRISRPVLIKGCPVPLAASNWTDDYLVKKVGDSAISVAVTPNGRADAITGGPDGKLYFAEPHVQKMTMADFISSLSSDSNSAATETSAEVHYLQSQNGNLFSSDPGMISEFRDLRCDISPDLSWCTEALGNPPDAVNLWIGDSRSVTSIHSDPYENIYAVVRGSKTFTLLPPTEGWCMEERTYPHAQYTRSSESKLVLTPSPPSTAPVRWSSVVDPNAPGALPCEAHPIQITVQAGESLYLPAGWWHYVRQSGKTIAVNYWYDLESQGMSWVLLNLFRGLGEPPASSDDQDVHDA